MLLEAKNISFRYGDNFEWVLRDFSLQVEPGENVALVGPSGCGKSTLARILSGYLQPDSGEVLLNGRSLPTKGFCPVQMIHQQPEQAVNPRHTISRILNEGWEPTADLMKNLGIEPEWLTRRPGELSGGELQRICIARVLGPGTKFLICDEISTMLDVITQARIWQIVLETAEMNQLGLVVVTHNKELAQRICHRTIDTTGIAAERCGSIRVT